MTTMTAVSSPALESPLDHVHNNNHHAHTTSSSPMRASATAHAPVALDPLVCQKASRYAMRVHEEMSKRSKLLAQETQVPALDRGDVLPFVGELLGQGGFNSVYELSVPSADHNDDNAGSSSTALQKLISNSSVSNTSSNNSNTNNPKLAIKFLSDHAMSVPEEFCNGAADLLMEAKYLTALSSTHPHPNVIGLHAVARTGPQGFAHVGRAGYFIVLDRLMDTLDRRMDVWVELQQRNVAHSKKMRGLDLQRLLVAQDIMSAVQHLHQLSIVFRDLKPDNIGFDDQGRVKVFDFGLAKGTSSSRRSMEWVDYLCCEMYVPAC
jgi:serine/threonine protein kinase